MKQIIDNRYLLVFISVLVALSAVVYVLSDRDRVGELSGAWGDAFARNDLSGAISLADEVLARRPDDVEALLSKAAALAQKGSFEFKEREYGVQVIQIAEQVLELDAKNSEAYRLIGYAHEIMQEYARAHVAYEQAIHLNPRNIAAISQNAHAYDLEGDLIRAKAGYTQALAIDAQFTQARMGLARLFMRTGDYDKALEMFKAASETDKNTRVRSEAAYSAGIIENVLLNSEEAERSMRYATSIDPQFALGWVGLGEVLFDRAISTTSKASLTDRDALITESFGALEHALSINFNQSAAHYRIAVQLASLGRTDEALAIFKALKTIVPNDITLSELDKKIFLDRVDASAGAVKDS